MGLLKKKTHLKQILPSHTFSRGDLADQNTDIKIGEKQQKWASRKRTYVTLSTRIPTELNFGLN